MWPEILPGFAVMVGALTVSGLAIGIIDRLETGGKPRRYHVDKFDEYLLQRDRRITGSYYEQKV
jgi:hypothetical protein